MSGSAQTHPDQFGDQFTAALGYSALRTSERAASAWLPSLAFSGADLMEKMASLAFITDATPGVVCGAAALPSWVVTSDLFMRIIETDVAGPLRADAELTVQSASLIAADVVLIDEGRGGLVVGAGSVGHVVRDPPEDFAVPMNMPVGIPFGRPSLGARPDFQLREADGELELARTELVTNPLGFVHGSVLVALACERVRRMGYEADNIHVRYGRPVRGRGARTRLRSIADQGVRLIVGVDVVDVDRPDRVACFTTIEIARGLAASRRRRNE